MNRIPVFYSDELLANSDSWSPSAGKPKPVVESWLNEALPIEIRLVVPATVEELSFAHDPAFVRSILACGQPKTRLSSPRVALWSDVEEGTGESKKAGFERR